MYTNLYFTEDVQQLCSAENRTLKRMQKPALWLYNSWVDSSPRWVVSLEGGEGVCIVSCQREIDPATNLVTANPSPATMKVCLCGWGGILQYGKIYVLKPWKRANGYHTSNVQTFMLCRCLNLNQFTMLGCVSQKQLIVCKFCRYQ